MADLLKTLETVKKALKPKPQKPKLTPAQFKQKAKLEASVNKVIQGIDGTDTLMKEALKMVGKLAITFIQQAPEKVSQASASLPKKSSESDEPDQSSDPKA